jgi:hypothetical protein
MTDENMQRPPANRLPRILWWGYFGTIVALFGLTLVNFIGMGLFDSIAATLVSWATLSFDIVCIAGLYGYIRSMPLFVPGFWRVMVALLLAKVLLSAGFLVPNLVPWESAREQYVSLAGLLSLVWMFPMLMALWHYASKMPQIWREQALIDHR